MAGITGLATFADFLNQMSDLGVFKYLLPFLIVFAIIYGVLTKSKIFGENAKAVNAIVAAAAGLISLQFELVPNFFAAIFPRMGIGLAVLLAFIVFMGLFVKFDDSTNDKWAKIFFPLLGVVIAIVVMITAFYNTGYPWGTSGFSNFWDSYGNVILVLVVFIGIIITIIATTKSK